MGGGIAQVAATAGFDVVVYDIDPEALRTGREHATVGRYGLDSGVARGKLTREQADTAAERLTFTEEFEAAAHTDLVIEAVPERLDLKIRVFRDLDAARPRPRSCVPTRPASRFKRSAPRPIGQTASSDGIGRRRARHEVRRDRSHPRHE